MKHHRSFSATRMVSLIPGNPDAAVAFFAREQVYSDVVKEFSAAELATILRFMRHITRLEPSALIEHQGERLSADRPTMQIAQTLSRTMDDRKDV